MEENKIINSGRINGLGESLVNTNSKDFKFLQELIKEHATTQEEEAQIENGLLSVRFQMESYLSAKPEAADVIPAGLFVEKLLKVINVSKKQFAEYIEVDYSNFIAVLKGRRKINSELAIKLGQIFQVNPVIWLHLESKNELTSALVTFKDSFSLSGLLKRAS